MIVNEQNTKVSVVMCTYNGGNFIKDQLNSIINQTYPVFEIIIQDDCSTDNTWDIIQEYANNYPDLIHAYRNEINLGPHKNFKSAFKRAKGNYIAPSDQDDIWMLDKIEKLLSLLIEKNVMLAFAQDTTIYEDGEEGFFQQFIETIEKNIYGNHLYGHSTLFKAELLDCYKYAEFISFDLTLSLYCSITGNYAETDERLCVWRRHEKACTLSANKGYDNSRQKNNKYAKFIYTLLNVQKKKSDVISRVFTARSKFVKNYSNNEINLIASEIAENVAKQTLFSFLKAGFLHVKIHILSSEYRELNAFKKIASLLFAFRIPFVYWYEWHENKHFD